MDPARTARELWPAVEAVHALVYFADAHRDAMTAAGTKGFWMGYFASRAAPMGEVTASVVEATFHGFAPSMVARAIPDAWRFTGGADAVLAVRTGAVDAALGGIVAPLDDGVVAEAADRLWAVAAGAPTTGRPLAAANRALPRPDQPHVALWQACTTLREHRGDGHVVALVAHGVDGPTAHWLKAAAGGASVIDADAMRTRRGWSEEAWAAARDGAVADGLIALDAGGDPDLTDAGRELVDAVEGLTDRLAGEAWAGLADDDRVGLVGALRPILDAVLDSGVVPYPNPVGVPRPG